MIDFNPRRVGDRIIIFLEKDTKPIYAPPEYQPFIVNTYNDWDNRVIALKQHSNAYSRPLFERIWFFVALTSLIVLPTLLHRIVTDAVFDPTRPFDSLVEARWITFGIYIGVFVLFWGPMMTWKALGARKVNRQIRKWNEQDRAAHPNATFIPTWKLTLPGIFMIYGKLKITLPPVPQVTIYSHNAYIPPYLATTLAPPGYNYYPPTGPNYNPALVAQGGPAPNPFGNDGGVNGGLPGYGNESYSFDGKDKKEDVKKPWDEDVKDRV
jgi:hypothetical protein